MCGAKKSIALGCWRRAGGKILPFKLHRGTLLCRHSQWWVVQFAAVESPVANGLSRLASQKSFLEPEMKHWKVCGYR